MQDNREWGWEVFAWWFRTPFNKNKQEHVVTVTVDSGDGKNVVLVDRFGQTTRKKFPGRVDSLEELKDDAASEDAYYASLSPAKLDAFGGLPGGGEKLGLRKTGFFHVQRHGDRWILVDPVGNAFFHLGICSFGCGEDYTYVEGRESIYEWLPPHESEFRAAYHPEPWWNPRAFSFYRANLIRKYGPLAEEAFLARMVCRVRQRLHLGSRYPVEPRWRRAKGGARTTLRSGRGRQQRRHNPELPTDVERHLPQFGGSWRLGTSQAGKVRQYRLFGIAVGIHPRR